MWFSETAGSESSGMKSRLTAPSLSCLNVYTQHRMQGGLFGFLSANVTRDTHQLGWLPHCSQWHPGRGALGAPGAPYKPIGYKGRWKKHWLGYRGTEKLTAATVNITLGRTPVTAMPRGNTWQDSALTHRSRSVEAKQGIMVAHSPLSYPLDSSTADHGKTSLIPKQRGALGTHFFFFIVFFFCSFSSSLLLLLSNSINFLLLSWILYLTFFPISLF